MRIEHDEAGVSVFVDERIDAWRIAQVGGIGGSLIGAGLLLTAVGLTTLGPGLLYAGIGWFLSVPWWGTFRRDTPCERLRIDHLGVRANAHRLSPAAEIVEDGHGLRICDGREFLVPIGPGPERDRLRALLDRGMLAAHLRCGTREADVPEDLSRITTRAGSRTKYTNTPRSGGARRWSTSIGARSSSR